MMTEPIANPNPTKTSMKRPPSDDEESFEVGNVKKIKLLEQDVGDGIEDGINEKVIAIGNDVINGIENHIVVQKEEIEDSKCNGTHVEFASDANPATDENVKCENKSDLNGETTPKTENDKTFSHVEKVTSLEGTPENSTTKLPHADTCKSLLDDNQSNANIENEAICDNSNLNSSVNLTASVHNNIVTNTKTDEPTVPPCDSNSEKDAESKLNSIQPAPSECTDLISPNAQSLLVSYSDSKSSLSNGNTNEPKTDSVSETKDNLHIEEKTMETNNVDNADIFAERDFDDIECLESTNKTTESIELADKDGDFDNGECSKDKTTESIELTDKESDFDNGECLELTEKTTESIELADTELDFDNVGSPKNKTTESIELTDKESDFGDGECLEPTNKTAESIDLADKDRDFDNGACPKDKITESIELEDKESDFGDGECLEPKDKTTESIELADKEIDFDNGECFKDKTTESIELADKEFDFDNGECSKDKTTESIELADKEIDFDNGECSKDKTGESIELADKEIDFDNGECSKDKTNESIELADKEIDFDNGECLESTDKTTESIELGNVSDTINDSVIIPEKKSSKLENDKSEDVVLEKEESHSDENHSKGDDEISAESKSDEALSKEDKLSTQRISDEKQRIDESSPQCESDETQTKDYEISTQNKLDEKQRTDIEISTLGDCETEISKTEEGLNQNEKEIEETKSEESPINPAHEMETVDIPVIDLDNKVEFESAVVNQLKNTEISHIEQDKQIIDQETDHNEKCNDATIEDINDISDEPQVKKIKLNEADSTLIEDNVENDGCDIIMIDSSNNRIIKEDLKGESEDVPMETELTIPPSEIPNSTSENIASSKKNKSSTCEPEKLLNVPTDDPLVAVQDDVNEPDVKEHDIKTESQESKTVENSEKVEEKNTYETNAREDEELVLVKEVNKVIEEIDAKKECKTETLPNENSNSFKDSQIKAKETDEAKECKNETVLIIADSSKNSNLEKNVADDVNQCGTESESNKAEDELGQPVKQDLTTQEKEESTDDDIAIVNISSKEIVNLADTSSEYRSESANENIENSNLEKHAPLEITASENVDSDIELIEADSTKKIDNVNENNKADDVISTDKNMEDNVSIHDTVKDEAADLEKEEKTIVLNGSNVESDPKPVDILTENEKSDVEINSNEKLIVPTEDSVENITDSQLDGMENHQNDIDKHKHDIEIDSIVNDDDDDMDCGDNLVIDDIVDSDVELVEDAVKDAKDTSEVHKIQNDLVIDTDTTIMDVHSPVGNEEGSVIPASKVILPIDLDNDNTSSDKIEPIVNQDIAHEDKAKKSVVVPDSEEDKTESTVKNTSILPIDLDNADNNKDTNELVLNADNVDNTESVVKDNVDKDKAESVVDAEKETTESSLTKTILRSHLDAKDSSKDTATETSAIKSKDDDDEIIFIKECKKASDCTCVMCDGKKKSTDKKDKQDNEEKVGQKDSTAKKKKDVMPKIHEKLENLTKKGMEKLVNTLFAKFFAYESETGKMRELLGKLQSENATIKSVCQAQAKQLKELSHLHDKAVAEIETFKAENNGGLPPMPVKITRSVGLQVKVSPPAEKKRPATAASTLNTRLASLKRKRGSPAPSPPRPAASQQARSLPSSPLASPKPPAQSAAYRPATFSTMAVRKSTGGMSPRFAQRGNPARPLGLTAAASAGGLRILPPRAVNSNAVNAAARPILSPRAPVGRVITRSPAGGVPRSPTPATITVKPPSSGVETINLDDDDSPRASHHQQSMKIVRPNNSVPVRFTSTAGNTARAPGQGAPPRVYVPLSQGIKLRPATGSTGNILTSVANTSSSTTYILETSAGPIPFQTNSNVRLNLKSNVTTANAPVRLQYQGHPAPVPTTPAAVNLPLEARYKLVPAAPKLRVQLADAGKGIQLTWSLDSTPDMASIESYQLYAYQENKAMAISSNLWKNIGKLEALPLPMACTLTQFTAGHTYHFLVRAIDVFKRFSAFSNPGTIHLRT